MAEMRRTATSSGMPDVTFLTVVSTDLFSQPWNQTDDLFQESTPGLVSGLLGSAPSGAFVYDRCGWLTADKLSLLDHVNLWRAITKTYNKPCKCTPAPTTQPQPDVETTAAD